MSREETGYIVELIRPVTEGQTLLVVEHDMSVVFTLCDQVSVLVYGEIIASGAPADSQRQPRGAGSLSRRGGRVSRLLEIEGLHAHYDKSHILRGVSLNRAGEIVSLLGRNGSGPLDHAQDDHGPGPAERADACVLEGRDLAGVRAFRIARAGYRLRARGARDLRQRHRRREHAHRHATARPGAASGRWSICTATSPNQGAPQYAAGMLSGGEQQMLTICRSLLGNPRVILIDEPTEGLAPKIVEVVTEIIRDICRQGVSVLLVEQKLTIALRVAERVYVMGHGQIVFEGSPEALRDSPEVRRNWLEVN